MCKVVFVWMGIEYYSHYWHIAYGTNAMYPKCTEMSCIVSIFNFIPVLLVFVVLHSSIFMAFALNVDFSFPLFFYPLFQLSSSSLYLRSPFLRSYAIHAIFLILLLTNDCLRRKGIFSSSISIPSVCLLLHLEHYLEITYYAYITLDSNNILFAIYTFYMVFLDDSTFRLPFRLTFYCFACAESRFQILHTSTLENLMSDTNHNWVEYETKWCGLKSFHWKIINWMKTLWVFSIARIQSGIYSLNWAHRAKVVYRRHESHYPSLHNVSTTIYRGNNKKRCGKFKGDSMKSYNTSYFESLNRIDSNCL